MLDAVTATSICQAPGNMLAGNEFHRLQVSRRTDLQPHPIAFEMGDGGLSLLGAQWGKAQPRGVPPAVAPGGFVLLGSAEQLPCHLIDVGGLVDIDLGGAQVWMFGADDPDQTS